MEIVTHVPRLFFFAKNWSVSADRYGLEANQALK